MKGLQIAFSQKERAERLLANLEDLNDKGDIDDAQYEAMKTRYTKMRDEADAEIASLKEQLQAELEDQQRDVDIYTQELKNLEARFKVGEISADEYKRGEQRARKKLEKVQAQVTETQELYEAQSSGELGGSPEREAPIENRRVRSRARANPTGLSIGDVFSESFDLYRSNPVIVVPSVLFVLLGIIATVLGLGSLASLPWLLGPASPGAFEAGLSTFYLGFVIFSLVFIILFLLVEAMTVGMIRDAYQGGYASVGDAFWDALGKIGALIIAAILVSVILSIGYLLLVIPGVILTFLLWFVVQAIMVEDEGGAGALRRSVEFFIGNAADAFIIVLASFGLLVVLGAIPILGWILLLVGMPYLLALPTVLYIDRA